MSILGHFKCCSNSQFFAVSIPSKNISFASRQRRTQQQSGLNLPVAPPPKKPNCTQFLILTAAKCCLLVWGFSLEFLALSVLKLWRRNFGQIVNLPKKFESATLERKTFRFVSKMKSDEFYLTEKKLSNWKRKSLDYLCFYLACSSLLKDVWGYKFSRGKAPLMDAHALWAL